MENADKNRRTEVQSSLGSIAESADSWLSNVQKQESWVRLASAFLTASVVFAAVGIGLVGYLFSQGQLNFHDLMQRQVAVNMKFLIFSVGISALVIGIASGVAMYFVLKRKHREELRGLSSLVIEMKDKISKSQYQQTDSVGQGFMADALAVADKILVLLPQLIRKRNYNAILFGVVAFIIANAISHNPGVAVIVGLIVWLFFRYEAKKTTERELSRLEEQKRLFEQRKNDFLNSLR